MIPDCEGQTLVSFRQQERSLATGVSRLLARGCGTVYQLSCVSQMSSTNVTDRRTDRRTDGRTSCNRSTALCTIVHRAVKIRCLQSIISIMNVHKTLRQVQRDKAAGGLIWSLFGLPDRESKLCISGPDIIISGPAIIISFLYPGTYTGRGRTTNN